MGAGGSDSRVEHVSQDQAVRDLGLDPLGHSQSLSDSVLPQPSSSRLVPDYDGEVEEDEELPRDHDTPWTVVGEKTMQRLLAARRGHAARPRRLRRAAARVRAPVSSQARGAAPARSAPRVIPEAGKFVSCEA